MSFLQALAMFMLGAACGGVIVYTVREVVGIRNPPDPVDPTDAPEQEE